MQEFVTVNETKTISVIADQTNLFSSQFFTWVPTPSVTLTFEPGSTYVAYTRLYGGLDFQPTPTDSEAPVMTGTLDISDPEPTCEADVSFLYVWPGAAEEYSLFIQTYTNAPGNSGDSPVSLPPAAIQYLSKHPEIQSVFNGSDIATCTQRPTLTTSISTELTSVFQTIGTKPPPRPSQPASIQFPPESSAPDRSAPFDTPKPTSTPGYLRTPKPNPEPSPGPGPNSPPNPPNPPQSPDIPAVIASILNDPKFTPAPQPPPNNPEQSIAIGNTVVPVHPVIQNPQNPQNPQNQQNPQNPGIVIGSQTLAPGQATTINGVVVSVPNGGGPSVVVGGTTIGVNPAAPTGPAVLTVGGNTITANPQGQFVVGSQTLTPGGPAIIVDGSTLSLGPSGTIAVVNGVTQTLANAPFITGPPALTINGQIIPATVRNGVTQFVVGPGQTLTPGGVIVVGGTTYSMPDDGSGSTIVVNGVTQTLNNAFGLPVLTLNGQSLIPATVVGGTTMWVVGPGQTLTPGGVIVVSGTTFSMPATASGSVVVINGVTSTLGQGPITAAPALTINGKTYSATVVDGTTQYILGPGTTLKPGEAITIDGTTYSLDPKGTALIINGKTSSIPKTPASNSATTTGSGSMSESTSRSSSRSSSRSTTSARDAGNFIASGIGITSKKGDAIRVGGLDKWAEGVVIGIAGWLLMLL
ncbi:hypothetical protein K469DRAFT_697438 [Zopfia rhizophila CBS 207.26]|uniref:Uncharacterized protein n=1 Tax=Zopfia rhizophila CBS 207.26 TaxID=1314779 RepID=A0A6A6DG86_9PEZI|nr:hypothetical protein K469DRAFT_697438 [Zopfia rhizophila CBS 207.26]